MNLAVDLADARGPRKGAQTAERILDAAEALFAERGFAGTTLRDVAGAVGVRTPSLYNHFPSKESLYAAVLERGLRPVLEGLAHLVEEGDRARQGARQVETMMRLLAARPKLPRLVQYEVLTGGERLSPMLREWIRPIFARAQQLVEQGPAAERWSADEIPLLVLALYHVFVGYFTIAPLYQDLNGEDLLGETARTRQTRFLENFVEVLFPSAGASRDGIA